MSVKDHKFQCSPIEVCATLMMISAKIRRLDMLFAGVEIEYSSVDKEVLKETLVVLDKYVLPVAHDSLKREKGPRKASAIIEEMKLVIADVVFEIQDSHNLLTDLRISFST
jgi:hypothetical protein